MTFFVSFSFLFTDEVTESPTTLLVTGKADSSLALLRQRPGTFPLPSSCLLHAKP